MSRLIDADALSVNLDGMMAVSPTGYIHGDTIADMIGDAPTIEPETEEEAYERGYTAGQMAGRKKGADNGCTFLTCKHGGFGDDACSKCRWAYRDMYEADEKGAQE